MTRDRSARDIVDSFWAAMQANDWRRAADHLTPGCVIDWPCSGERIVGRDHFVAIQERYPTNTGSGRSTCTALSPREARS